MAWDTVDLTVGGHDAGDTGLADGGLEWEELFVAHFARAEVRRCLVQAALCEAVPDHVLGRGDDAFGQVHALQAADVRAAQFGGEVRVLAVRFLDPAPARVTGHVEDGGKRMASAGRQHPPPDRRRHVLDEARIPGGSGADRLLEAECIAGEEAVERLLVDDRGDPQSRFLDEEALDLVGEDRNFSGTEVRGSSEAGDLADATPDELSRSLPIELADPDDLERPDRPELRDLLLDGHALEEVPDPRVHGQVDVSIGHCGGGHQPFSEPPVRPLTMCRSATT